MVQEFNIFRILAQARPAGIAAVTAYTKPTKALVTVKGLIVCNTTGGTVTYSLYVDPNGSTYDQTTAILYDTPLLANESDFIELPLSLEKNGTTIGIKTGTGNALNFTILGELRDLA